MTKVNGFNGDDKIPQGYKQRINLTKSTDGICTTKSVFMVRNNGKSEYLVQKELLFDYDKDGNVDNIEAEKFDQFGNLIERSYDENGNMIEMLHDNNYDGKWDR